MPHVLIAHSDPESRDLLRKALVNVAPRATWDMAANCEQTMGHAALRQIDVAVIEAELPPRQGERAAPESYPGVAVAVAVKPVGKKPATLLVVSKDVGKRLLSASRPLRPQFLSLDSSDRDCRKDAQDALAMLPSLQPRRQQQRLPVSAQIKIRFGITNLQCEWELIGKGHLASQRQRTSLHIQRPADFRFLLDRVRTYCPITKSSGPRQNLEAAKGWYNEVRDRGSQLFNTLLQAGLRDPYESALIHCDRELDRLNLHFDVDPDLHDVSIEYLVDQEQVEPHFLMLRSPMARSLAVAASISEDARPQDPRPPRILSVFSDVADHTVALSREGRWSGVRFEPLPRMPGLETELAYFRDLEANLPRASRPRILHASGWKDEKGESLYDALQAELAPSQKPYDIIHFAGHCFAPPGKVAGKSHAFLMMARPGERYADPLPIETFANWVKPHGARLVFLSACHSMTGATAYAMTADGISAVVGFRWDLPDAVAPQFVKTFYDKLLGRPRVSIAEALRHAKSKMYVDYTDNPIWAAPMLVMRQKGGWI